LSPVHWDNICHLRVGGRRPAHGETLMQDGRFVL
jgi:hypothetical protein